MWRPPVVVICPSAWCAESKSAEGLDHLARYVPLVSPGKARRPFAYTIKSVVYGCVIARLAGVPRIYSLLPGLGFTFVKPETLKQTLVQWLSKALHRFALKRADVIFMQNRDDVQLFTDLKILPRGVPVHVTTGSGVNLDEYPHVPLDGDPDIAAGRVRFVLVSRLLISKGVCIFAEAARRIKARYPHTEFHLVGPFDPNPNRVSEIEVEQWVKEGTLTHHGMVRDVAALLKAMHVFCLTTWYRERVPHASLEALSTGRAMITTDSVGARECVSGGENGFLLPPRDVDALVIAMQTSLDYPEQIAVMGRASRRLAEEVFDARLINQIILRVMNVSAAPQQKQSPLHIAHKRLVHDIIFLRWPYDSHFNLRWHTRSCRVRLEGRSHSCHWLPRHSACHLHCRRLTTVPTSPRLHRSFQNLSSASPTSSVS
jgi:glycosyltransferase involved in cell wall biosynthesis